MPDLGDKSFIARDSQRPSSVTSIAFVTLLCCCLEEADRRTLHRQIMTAFGELELAELREAFDEFDKV